MNAEQERIDAFTTWKSEDRATQEIGYRIRRARGRDTVIVPFVLLYEFRYRHLDRDELERFKQSRRRGGKGIRLPLWKAEKLLSEMQDDVRKRKPTHERFNRPGTDGCAAIARPFGRDVPVAERPSDQRVWVQPD